MEYQKEQPIGVMDSSLGGLTVVRELERLLPLENIVYFGDSANFPYGNRPKEEILKLTTSVLNFMREKKVKIVVVACGTISTIIDEIRKFYDFPIISIIEAVCNSVAAGKPATIGVFATNYTISAGAHKTLIWRLSPGTEVYGVPSLTLATLIDRRVQNKSAIEAEISSILETLLKTAPNVKDVILGCTHYPLIQDMFEKAAPEINFINPASLQVEAVKALLDKKGLLYKSPEPRLDIFASSESSEYEETIRKLKIQNPYSITIVK